MLRRLLTKRKSTNRFSEAAIEVKIWQGELPSVEAVRPARCPGCGNAGAPAGGRVGLVGHGLRPRDVRGPDEPCVTSVEGILTSNRPLEDWGKLLGDAAAVTAMLDRILHRAHVLKAGPRSYRMNATNLPMAKRSR